MSLRSVIYILSISVLSVLCLVRGFQLRAENPYAEFQQLQVNAVASAQSVEKEIQMRPELVESMPFVLQGFDSYRTMGQPDRAIAWLKSAAQQLSSQGDLLSYEEVLFHLANVYTASGKYAEALETYSLCFDMDKSAPDRAQRIPFDLNNVGVVVGMRGLGVASEAERQKQFDGAENCFRKAMEHVGNENRAEMNAITRQNTQVLSLKRAPLW